MKALLVDAKWDPKPGYIPTEREKVTKRALNGDKIFKDPVMKLVELPVPEPADDEVLLKVGGVGVCGGDLAFMEPAEDGYVDFAAHCKLPVVLGHEFAGEVVKVGSKVKNVKVGDLVTAETMNWCGNCEACRQGMFNQCKNLEEIGFTTNGGFAEYLVAKEKYCFDISALVDVYGSRTKAMEYGCLIEPMAVAYNSLFTCGGGFMPGEDAVVFGAGPIGASTIELLATTGAGKVIVFEKSAKRLEIAKQIGATHAYNLNELAKEGKTAADVIMELTAGKGAGIIAECTQFQQCNMPDMEKAVAVGGTIVQIGINKNPVPITTESIQIKGASFRCGTGSSGHGNWKHVINLIVMGRVDPSKFVNSRIYTLDEVKEAFLDAKKGEVCKNVVNPSAK